MKEPEEIVEAKLLDLLSNYVTGADIIGALSPTPEGEEKLAADTHIDVFVDQSAQGIDWKGPGVPCTYSVRVAVHYARADDKTGEGFRNVCRCVRTALSALLGDGCAALDGEGFYCDAFTLDSTSTSPDFASDEGGMSKTYNATVAGRYIPPTQEES